VLKAGMKADLVVLDQDIASVNPEQIKDAKVTGTVVGGRIVYER
jgi:predicted amidohydrolase YtcJ